MERVPEPELMDDAAQADAYARADFAGVNQAFVDRFVATFPTLKRGRMLDLGCGPADIPIRLARTLPGLEIVAVDGSEAMLREAERALGAAGLSCRVRTHRATLPARVSGGPFEAVISNSLLHHLHDPMVLWKAVIDAAQPNAAVLVVDLFRPESEEAARRIVETHAAEEHPILKQDFYNSLLAAFTPDEVRAQLEECGLEALDLEVTSDRHLAVFGRAPG